MKLYIGNGSVRDRSDIEALLSYDDAAIDEARHEVRAKALRQRRHGDAGRGREGARAARSVRRMEGVRHGR